MADWNPPYAIDDVPTLKGFENIFTQILSLTTTGVGIVCFLMLIVGGFKYLTSGGDPKQAASAQGTLTWAIAGLAIIIGAWLILKFISFFTGVDVTIFEIPSG